MFTGFKSILKLDRTLCLCLSRRLTEFDAMWGRYEVKVYK